MNRPDTQSSKSRPSTAHIRDYWIVILKRLPVVLFLTIVGSGLAYYVTQNQAPLYRASATIEMVLPRSGVRSADFVFAPSVLRDASYLNTQLQKLQMPTTLRDALEAEDVIVRPQLAGLTLQEVVNMHKGRVNARQRRGQYLVDVSVTGGRADILDDVTNALVRHFREEQRNETELRIERRRTELEERLAGIRSKIRLAEIDKRQALDRGGFTEGTFEADYLRLVDDLRKFVDEQTRVRLEIFQDQSAYTAFSAAIADGGEGPESLSQHPRIIEHAEIKLLRERVHEQEAQLDEIRKARNAGDRDPEVLSINRSIDRLTTRRRDLQDSFVRQFVIDFEGRSAMAERLDAEVDDRQRKLSDATSVKAEVDERTAEIERLDEDQRSARRESEALDPMVVGVTDAVRIVAPAREPNPNSPVSPNEPLNLTLGTLLGLLAGVGVAFVMEYLDDTIQTKDDLAKITDVALLGVIPRIEGRSSDTQSKDLFAFHQPKSTVSEAYRGVRTALTMRSHGTRNRVLALTSAGPREGKSTTVINLATVLAYASRRTLIIDADLRKPRVHKSFGVDNACGLTNVIVGDIDPREHCVPTEVPGVDVLPSGPIPPNPSELLGSERMRDVITSLREYYDHIIIDTPPIGAVTDAAVLGTIVDGVILVVHAGKTRAGIVQRGLEQMRYISAPIEGVILNNLQVKSRYYPGYYNYYYYYSYYGAGKARGRKAARKPSTGAGSKSPSGGDSPSP